MSNSFIEFVPNELLLWWMEPLLRGEHGSQVEALLGQFREVGRGTFRNLTKGVTNHLVNLGLRGRVSTRDYGWTAKLDQMGDPLNLGMPFSYYPIYLRIWVFVREAGVTEDQFLAWRINSNVDRGRPVFITKELLHAKEVLPVQMPSQRELAVWWALVHHGEGEFVGRDDIDPLLPPHCEACNPRFTADPFKGVDLETFKDAPTTQPTEPVAAPVELAEGVGQAPAEPPAPEVDGIKLNELQQALLRGLANNVRYIGVRAGWGSGKTTALVFAMLFISRTRPGTSVLMITDTMTRFHNVLNPEMQKWLAPLGWHSVPARGGQTVEWIDTNGTKVCCISYHRPKGRSVNTNSIEGLNITSGICLIDECQTFTAEVADRAFGRLRSGHPMTMIMVGLPVPAAWWINYAESRGGLTLFFSSMVNKDNLSKEWIEETENMPEDQKRSLIYNEPAAPEGQVFREWVSKPFPEGNLTPEGWTYNTEMEGRLAIDFGIRKPYVGIVVFDPDLQRDVLVCELTPKEVSIHQLAQLILMVAWPRAYALPNDGRERFIIDTASGDKAGRVRSDQTMKNVIELFALPPPEDGLHPGVTSDYGIGMEIRTNVNPARTDIRNSLVKMKSRILDRDLLCTPELWHNGCTDGQAKFMQTLGFQSNGNSFANALTAYVYKPGSDEPVKSGLEDPIDALRYDMINWRWSEGPREYKVAKQKPLKELKLSLDLPTMTSTRMGSHVSWRSRNTGR